MDHFPTGRTMQFYLNPERDVPIESQRVHGLSAEFLSDKPLFAHVAEEFLEFVGDAPLVIHNASFDIKFINAELTRVGRTPLSMARTVDTIEIAKRKIPGARYSLDELCKRFSIDLTARAKHGALLDAELTAQVYLELVGGRQRGLALAPIEIAAEVKDEAAAGPGSGRRPWRPASRTKKPRATPLSSPANWATSASGNWPDLSGLTQVGRHVRRCPWVGCTAAWPILAWYSATKSIGSIIKGGMPPSRTTSATIRRAKGNSMCGAWISRTGCMASSGIFCRPEQAGIGQFQQEKLTGLAFGMDAELQLDLEMLVVATAGLDVDAEFDLRPLGQAGGRAGIFEGQVLDVLAHDLKVGGRGGAFAVARELPFRRCSFLAFPLICGPRATMDGGPLTRKSREIRACGVFDEARFWTAGPPGARVCRHVWATRNAGCATDRDPGRGDGRGRGLVPALHHSRPAHRP